MAKIKSAELRSLREEEKTESVGIKGRFKKLPSPLSLLQAAMWFVGGVGKLLDFVEKFKSWLEDIDIL